MLEVCYLLTSKLNSVTCLVLPEESQTRSARHYVAGDGRRISSAGMGTATVSSDIIACSVQWWNSAPFRQMFRSHSCVFFLIISMSGEYQSDSRSFDVAFVPLCHVGPELYGVFSVILSREYQAFAETYLGRMQIVIWAMYVGLVSEVFFVIRRFCPGTSRRDRSCQSFSVVSDLRDDRSFCTSLGNAITT
jgi:hypothetical protein